MFLKVLIGILIFLAALLVLQVKQTAHWSYNLALAAVSIAMLGIVFLTLL